MFELIPIWVLVFLLLWKNITGKDWSCMFGFHSYIHYAGEKHGLHIDKNNNWVGTTRKLYTCRCGAYKPRCEEDIKNV